MNIKYNFGVQTQSASIALAALAFALAASGTALGVDAYLTNTSQIRSASNNQ